MAFPTDDLSLVAVPPAGLDACVTAQLRSGSGRLAVWDHQLAAAGRAVGDRGELPVLVTSSTGAGGLLGLVGRRIDGVRVEAVQSTLRDLDDLAGNTARVIAAAEALADAWSDEVELYVGLPFARGWERAADEVEAAGHRAAIVAGADRSALIAQLSGLIERDCPFTVQWTTAGPPLSGVVTAVATLIDDGDPAEAETQLDAEPRDWDAAALARIRRRLTRVGRIPPADAVR